MHTNASLQQLTLNTNQLHQQQQDIINQMAMMMTNHCAAAAVTQHTITCAPLQIYQTTVLPQYQQGYNIPQQQFGGWGTACRGGGGYSHGGGQPQCGWGWSRIRVPMPYVGGSQLIPYIPGGMQQNQQHQPSMMYSNKEKYFANHNICYYCGFGIENCQYRCQSDLIDTIN